MSVSRNCEIDAADYDDALYPVGEIDFKKSETGAKCDSCKNIIPAGAYMYFWDFETRDENGDREDVERYEYCEKCGDLTASLGNLGFCFDLTSNIHEQWEDYQQEIQEL